MRAAAFANIRAVLFDLDGTLIDSAPDLGHAVDSMRTARGLPSLPQDVYRPMAGMGARGMLNAAFDITPEHPDFDALREEFFSNYERCIHERTQPFGHVPQIVDALNRQRLRWGVVTNKTQRFAFPIVTRMAWFHSAGTIICGDTTAYAKPHPAPLLEAAARIGIDASQCVYVGDDERDIIAGRAAGMKTIAALYGYLGPGATPRQWGADALIENPRDLLKLLGLH